MSVVFFVINSSSQLNNVCEGFNTVPDLLQALNKQCYYFQVYFVSLKRLPSSVAQGCCPILQSEVWGSFTIISKKGELACFSQAQ